MKRIISMFLLIGFWFFHFGTMETLVAQEPVLIESTVPAELAARKDVAPLLSKLKLLRISESKFGARHPARAGIVKQIEELEARLRVLLKQEGVGVQPANPFPKSKSTPKIPSAVEEYEAMAAKAQSQPAVIPEQPKESTPKESTLVQPKGESPAPQQEESDTPYQLVEAFPKLKFDGLCSVGPFPAGGMLWGLENTGKLASGRIWQWQDDHETDRKDLFWETHGAIRSIAFDRDFEENGRLHIARVQKKPGDEAVEIHWIVLELERRPPFAVRPNSERVVASGDLDDVEGTLSLLATDEVIFLQASAKSITPRPDFPKLKSLGENCWALPVGQAANSPNESSLPSTLDQISLPVGLIHLFVDRSERQIWALCKNEKSHSIEKVLPATGPKLSNLHVCEGAESFPIRPLVYAGQDLGVADGSILIAESKKARLLQYLPGGDGKSRAMMFSPRSQKMKEIGIDGNSDLLVVDHNDGILRLLPFGVLY